MDTEPSPSFAGDGASSSAAGFDLDESPEVALKRLGGLVASRHEALKAADVTLLVVANAYQV